MSKYPIFVFEGIEGTGKSTQVKFISVYLKKKGFHLKLLENQGGKRIMKKLQKFYLIKNLILTL